METPWSIKMFIYIKMSGETPKTKARKMDIPAPSEFGYTIYTKSGCKYCQHAKRIFSNATFISCDVWLVEREKFLKKMDPYTGGHRTFPMIFKNREFIGGYTESINKILTDIDF
jgi:glutaredoxin